VATAGIVPLEVTNCHEECCLKEMKPREEFLNEQGGQTILEEHDFEFCGKCIRLGESCVKEEPTAGEGGNRSGSGTGVDRNAMMEFYKLGLIMGLQSRIERKVGIDFRSMQTLHHLGQLENDQEGGDNGIREQGKPCVIS
jgi:hypothetical protein